MQHEQCINQALRAVLIQSVLCGHKMKFELGVCVLFSMFFVNCNGHNDKKMPITTVSGSHVPKRNSTRPSEVMYSDVIQKYKIPYEPGQLIFEDNFDELDLQKWEHEVI